MEELLPGQNRWCHPISLTPQTRSRGSLPVVCVGPRGKWEDGVGCEEMADVTGEWM